MSATTTGSCVVCGMETNTRCSSCSSAGTDWMYFCSQEHQKLVWPWHKKVCGENGNPFTFPALSKDEVKYALSIIDSPLKGFGTLREKLASFARVPPERIPACISTSGQPGSPMDRQLTLLYLRFFCATFLTHSSEVGDTQQIVLPLSSVWQWAAHKKMAFLLSVEKNPAVYPRAWSSALDHHIFLWTLLRHLRLDARQKHNHIKERTYDLFCAQAFASLRRFVEEEIKPTYPEDAAAIAQAWECTCGKCGPLEAGMNEQHVENK
ncbi:hypothetical protein JCM8097_002068 [Rhodosporidiobolus ruineniae]